MHALLATAILRQAKVSLWYDPGTRVIEPHALGYGSDGQILLRAFQTDGASMSGEHIHWKLFRVDRIRTIQLTDTPFYGPRPGYKMNDKAMTRGIIAQLDLARMYKSSAD
ncbi:WYL domain-containing protein [Rhodopseudomonas sp. WA056]|nr:WYL domain-containing protein [Rhodopseudomonas sp. WA056]